MEMSMFGYQSPFAADRAAYDMMVLKEMGILDADTKKDELNDRTPGWYRTW